MSIVMTSIRFLSSSPISLKNSLSASLLFPSVAQMIRPRSWSTMTVKNFFGSLTLVMDRPFEVGDWVLIDDVEGSVEEVGFRSTRVRTFYQSVISLPNSKLLTAVVDNMGARRFRRWTTKLGVTYDTPPDTLDAFCEGLRELVRQHPHTRKDYFHVYVVGFAESSARTEKS